ncbi:MAG: hypothetical protein Kow0077_24530 [Anaerolineae bacterium]
MRKWIAFGLVLVTLAAFPLTALAQTEQGTGWIVAEGDGAAYLRGAGWVRISGSGTLLIRDRAGDAEIVVDGRGSRAENRGTLIYRGFDGNAYVRGSAITVALRGEDIHLEAHGTGLVILRGEGWYRTGQADHEVQGVWTAQGVRLQLLPTPTTAE